MMARSAKDTKKAKRWTHAVTGDLLVVLDAGVAAEGKYCTRSKYVADAIREKVARSKEQHRANLASKVSFQKEYVYEEPGQASQPEPLAKVTTHSVGTSTVNIMGVTVPPANTTSEAELAELGINPTGGGIAGNPFAANGEA